MGDARARATLMPAARALYVPALTRRRRWAAVAVAVVLLVLLTAVLGSLRDVLALASVLLLYLGAVVAVAVVGGVWPALGTAVVADLLVNWFFVPPFQTLTIEDRDNLIGLVVFVGVAATVSVAVEAAASRRAAVARSEAEAEVLAAVATERPDAADPAAVLAHVRRVFGMDGVALVADDAGTPRVLAQVGEMRGGGVSLDVPAGDGMRLVAAGPEVLGEDTRLLSRLAGAAARAVESRRLAADAARAEQLAEVDRWRAALLAAVGHDLRTPLAGIKAAVSGLRAPDVTWTGADRDELLATVEESADRLDRLLADLLDMSRLQAGALSVDLRPVALDEALPAELLGPDVDVDLPEPAPLVLADPALLERVVANLVANALRFAGGQPVRISAAAQGVVAQLAVVDRGPGVPPGQRDRMFAPFQRLGDRSAGGVGLGLAIARGFTEAMGGTLVPSDTVGGGLTMTVTLPTAPPPPGRVST